ncbi:hypothetical protein MKW92_050380, partial [Papaver armeniacum]
MLFAPPSLSKSSLLFLLVQPSLIKLSLYLLLRVWDRGTWTMARRLGLLAEKREKVIHCLRLVNNKYARYTRRLQHSSSTIIPSVKRRNSRLRLL